MGMRDELIKLGTTNPELRPHIRPLLAATQFDYQVVGDRGTETFDSVEDLLKKHRSRGVETNSSRRPELQGQPKLEGFLGPMYNGNRGGKTMIRYESQGVYNQMSRAASQGFTLVWTDGTRRLGEVKGGPWGTEQEALEVAKQVRHNLNALMRTEGRSGDLLLLDPNGNKVRIISIA